MSRSRNDPELFGPRLRRLREAAALTQEELATRAGLTTNAIGSLERGERRRPYPHTVRALADALGLDDEERAALGRAARPAAAEPPEPSPVPAPPLPESADVARPASRPPTPPTALLGRDREMGEVLDLVRSGGTRVLTLTGPGGVGKTRFALEVAAALAPEFPDGAVVVELAPVGEVALVLTTVARALGLRETGGRDVETALAEFLRDRRPLLVLDNLEHLLAVAPDLAELLARCPDLVVLATSRAPLRIRAEREYPLAPLAVPDPRRTPDAATVAAAPAARMFLDRARAAAASFTLTEENAAAVAAICWRLDGLPLALELAAARARFLGPTALLARLDEAVGGGGARDLPERQRTMRATLDWSHDLLSAAEQTLFRRLAVFTGGFPLAGVQDVAGPDVDDVLGALGGLVEQSLVVPETGDEPRFRMLEPVRQYAAERLAAAGETDLQQTRHADHFVELGRAARPALRTSAQARWLDLLQREHDNLRAALARLLDAGRAADAAALGWNTWLYWALRGHAGEGCRWMERVVAAPLPALDRARALGAMAGLQYATGEIGRMRASARAAAEVGRDAHDVGLAAEATILWGSGAVFEGDLVEGAALLADALAGCRATGDRWGIAHARIAQGQCALVGGDLAEAAAILVDAEAIARELAGPFTLATCLNIRATAAQLTGDDDTALTLLEEAAALAFEVRTIWTLIYTLPALAGLAARRGRPEVAASLFGAASAMAAANSVVVAFPPTRDLLDRDLPGVREQLGEAAFRLAWEAGQAMTPDGIPALAGEISRLPAPR